MEVQLGDYDSTHNFFVCRDSTHAILGNDFIFLQAISIHVTEGRLEFQGHEIPLFNIHGARARKRVFLARAVNLPPLTEVEVPTYIRGRHVTPRPQMFEPKEEFFEETGTLAPRMIFESTDHHPRMRIFNPTETTVTVGIHRCLGTIEPVDDFLAEATEGGTTHKANAHGKVMTAEQENEGTEVQQEESYTDPPEDELDEKYRFSVDNMPPHLQQLVEDSVANLTDTQQKIVTVLLFHFSDILREMRQTSERRT